MKSTDQQSKFFQLRQKYSYFVYQSYQIEQCQELLRLTFNFNLADCYHFSPVIEIPFRSFYSWKLPESSLQNLAFHIGMIELISYWKLSCAPQVIIRPHKLTEAQLAFWKKLYYQGMGEFFYVNGITVSQEDYLHLISEGIALKAVEQDFTDGVLVPVGGGKDSVVSLELLKGEERAIPLIINPRPASSRCAAVAGFEEDQTAVVWRQLDPLMLELNQQGFLNGHTPFSALLAFVSLLIAAETGCRHIALSNESSASEATVPGTDINHQYSKSFDFEQDFRAYVTSYIHPQLNYFSLLRPLNELQIAERFSLHTAYHRVFKSCNVGSKTDSWCGQCPKCLFTWIVLSPFLGSKELEKIFGKPMEDDSTLIDVLESLAGQTAAKPFECVGTIDEVQAVLNWHRGKETAFAGSPLLRLYFDRNPNRLVGAHQLTNLLQAQNRQHFVPRQWLKLMED
ncbi:MAG: hypothetical protein H0S84_09170 [Bacteroidales bacterium]|nr:hypothetical protein [Bacteroidales bacterium]